MSNNHSIDNLAHDNMSKQLSYYYRHRTDRLHYQRNYYHKHKTTILTKKRQRYLTNKVKRTTNNISLIREIYSNAYTTLRRNYHPLFMEAFFHTHGRPRSRERRYNKKRNGRLRFHLIPNLNLGILKKYGIVPYIASVHVDFEHPTLLNARTLTIQTAHLLGLKMGDSMVWKEENPYTCRIETHTLCFDGSGLDMSHLDDVVKLTEMRVETELKGIELLSAFANKYSINGYLQVWRGNKLLSTSEPENALKDYLKQFPLAQTVSV